MWSPAALVALVSFLAGAAVFMNIQCLVWKTPQLTMHGASTQMCTCTRFYKTDAALDVRLCWNEATARRVLGGMAPEGRAVRPLLPGHAGRA